MSIRHHIFVVACVAVLLSVTAVLLAETAMPLVPASQPAIKTTTKPSSQPAAVAKPISVCSGPLEVFPAAIGLRHMGDAQGIVVRLNRADGVTLDVTSQAVGTIANDQVAKFDHALVRPLVDGQTQLRIKYEDRTVSIPITVKDALVDPPVSFHLDVMPVLFRAGCNSGACHGSARGKDGFRMSLFGFDADGDYYRLTHEIPGRRVNLALPADSLMLKKATGKVPHTGGTRFNDDSEYYSTLMRWIEAGAVNDAMDIGKPVSLEILPRDALLETDGAKTQFITRATYSDGSQRDVTRLTLFSTSNDNSALVSPDGLVTSAKRGEAFVMARFATFTVGAQVIVIPRDAKFDFPNIKQQNFIDALVDAKLKKMRIVPSPLCSDEEFLRRATLDVVGLLPTVAEHDRFVASSDIHKREKLVDDLLARKEFVEMWVMKWAELLQIRSSDRVSYKAALLYYEWLQDRIEHNVPFDQIVQELLDASGGTFKNPASNYYQIDNDPLKTAENTAQVFMGMRIGCAQCHNHPFDHWTMDDYYSFAAFFSQVARKQGEDPRETIISDGGGSEVRNPVTNKVAAPKFLGADSGVVETRGISRRQVLGKWIASPENPWFARNLANMVWAHFLGHGIIDPVDDVRASNPPSNPELLDALGQKFQEYHYDFKRLVRDICTSRTYQLASETNATNAGDERNFSHAIVRRIRAEVLLDCICQATDSREKFKGLPLGARAVQIADGQTSNYFLTTFGRATRETVCSCEVKMEPNLSQALALLNGETIQRKIRDGQTLKGLNESKASAAEKIRELYIRCLGRPATRGEQDALQGLMSSAGADTGKSMEDLFWALLNSQEFIFNH